MQENRQTGPGHGNVLCFSVAPYHFCLPAIEVVSIIMPPRLTRLPFSPADVPGIFEYLGEIATCFDLRRKFSLPSRADRESGRLLLGRDEGALLAFLVDKVSDIRRTETLDWHTVPIPTAARRVVDGCYLDGDEIILATSISGLHRCDASTFNSISRITLNTLTERGDAPESSVAPTRAPTPGSGADVADGDVGVSDDITKPFTGAIVAFPGAAETLPARDSGATDVAQSPAPATRHADGPGKATGGHGGRAFTADGPSRQPHIRALPTRHAGPSAIPEHSNKALTPAADGDGRSLPTRTAATPAIRSDGSGDAALSAAALKAGNRAPLQRQYPAGMAAVAVTTPTASSHSSRPESCATAGHAAIPTPLDSGAIAVFGKPDQTVTATPGADDTVIDDMRAQRRHTVNAMPAGVWWLWPIAAGLLLLSIAYPLFIAGDSGAVAPLPATRTFRDSAQTAARQRPSGAAGATTTQPRVVAPVAMKTAQTAQPAGQDRQAVASDLQEVLRIEDSDLLIRIERDRNTSPAIRPAVSAAMDTDARPVPDAAQSTITADPGHKSVVTEDLPQSPASGQKQLQSSPDEPVQVVIASATPADNKTERVIRPGEFIRHRVVRGDTLWDIARHYLGDPFRYPQLARLSRIRNPDLIYPGDLVTISRRENVN